MQRQDMNHGTLQAETADRPLDWSAACSELVSQCADLVERDDRVAMLEKLCVRLGDELYPAFLRLLCTLEHRGDESARKLIANTLAYGLTTGRLPSGQLPAWGVKTSSEHGNPFSRSRHLGPIEFLCAWYSQPTRFTTLNERSFRDCLATLLRLISTDAEASYLYAGKLMDDGSDPLSGLLSSQTRRGLQGLASAWHEGVAVAELPTAYLLASQARSGLANLGDPRDHYYPSS